jgi:hypothetical protein
MRKFKLYIDIPTAVKNTQKTREEFTRKKIIYRLAVAEHFEKNSSKSQGERECTKEFFLSMSDIYKLYIHARSHTKGGSKMSSRKTT